MAADFDIEAARRDGVPDEAIARHLAEQNQFDYEAMHRDGVPDSAIIDHLAKLPMPAVEPSLGQKARTIGKAGLGMAGQIGKSLAEGVGRDIATFGRLLPGSVPGAAPSRDVAMLGLDVAGAFTGGLTALGTRSLATKVALSAMEAGTWGGIYNGMDAVFQGASAEETAKAAGVGAAIGAPLGPIGLGVGALAGRAVRNLMARRAEQAAADAMTRAATEHKAAYDAAKTAVQELDPALNSREVQHLAQQSASRGVPVEQVLDDYRSTFQSFREISKEYEQAWEQLVQQKQAEFERTKIAAENLPSGMGLGPMYEKMAAETPRIPPGISAPGVMRRAAEEAVGPAPGFTESEIRDAIIKMPEEQARIAEQAWDETMAPRPPRQPEEIRMAPIQQYGKKEPFYGLPHLREATRATEAKPSIKELPGRIRSSIRGSFLAYPDVAAPLQRELVDGMREVNSSQERANLQMHDRLGHWIGKGATAASRTYQLSDYMGTLDQITRVKKFGGTGAGGATLEELQVQAQLLAEGIATRPDADQILGAHTAARNLLDDMWERSFRAGYITENQYHTDYTPTQRLFETAENLHKDIESTPIGRRLGEMLHRNEAGEYTERNVIRLIGRSLAALERKEAEDRMFIRLRAIPGVDITKRFHEGQRVDPRSGYAVYRPGVAMPGWKAATGGDPVREELAKAIDGAVAEKKVPDNVYMPGTYVLPTPLVETLNHLYPSRLKGLERRAKPIFDMARLHARQLTVFSPTNTPLNAMSDTPMAGMYAFKNGFLPGFIRFYPRSIASAWRGAMLGQTDATFRRAIEHGFGAAPVVHSFGGETAPEALLHALGESQSPLSRITQPFYRARTFVEAVPRLAGAQAAEAQALTRGATAEEANRIFGRVGGEITLPYGSGDPAITRARVAIVLMPFWKYTGMATQRLLETTREKPIPSAAIIFAPMVASSLWNTHNDEFREAEYALPPWQRGHMHFIVPDGQGRVQRDKNGIPLVWRSRFWFPEEVMSFFGLGNLPARIMDLRSGYTTPLEAAQETGTEFGKNVTALPAALQAAKQFATGQSSLTGQQLEPYERIEGLLPLPGLAMKTLDTAKNQGVGEAVKQLPTRMLLIGPSGLKGGGDAKKAAIIRQITEKEKQIAAAELARNYARVDRLKKRHHALTTRLRQLNATIQKRESQ